MVDVEAVVLGAVAPRPRQARPIVLIGAGGVAREGHLPAYAKAGYPVAAVVDLDPERADRLAAEFGIRRVCSTIAEAVAYAPREAVFDCTVPAAAMRGVLRQLPDGAACLLQKPMGETLAEAEELLRICRDKGLTAAVNFQLRWAPAMMAARALYEAGAIGEVHDCEVSVSVHMPWELWSFLDRAPRLEILYHSIHYVDLIRSWFGNPTSVYARTVKSPATATLAATKSVVVFEYGDSKRVFLAANHSHDFDAEKQRSWVQWEGMDGAMRARMGVNLNYPKGRPDALEYVLRDGAGWRETAVSGNWFPHAFAGSMGSLQAYVQGEAAVLPTGVEDAVDTMRVVEAAYLSSERGGVALPEIGR